MWPTCHSKDEQSVREPNAARGKLGHRVGNGKWKRAENGGGWRSKEQGESFQVQRSSVAIGQSRRVLVLGRNGLPEKRSIGCRVSGLFWLRDCPASVGDHLCALKNIFAMNYLRKTSAGKF